MADPQINPEASKSRALDYEAAPTVRDRLLRYLPSMEQLSNFLKTLVWVAPLTLLIWVYAEREQSVIQPNVPVPIEVRTTGHDRLVTLRRPADKMIIVELSGPRAKLDRVRELLQAKEDGKPIQIDVDPQIGLGGQELLTVSQINNLPVFKNNGITVKSAQPPYLFVDIDSYDERDATVKAPPEVAGLLTEKTSFFPATVKLRAPSLILKDAADKGPLVVYADLAKREELKGRTANPKLENVALYWSQRENVSIAPFTVAANLDIKPRDVELTIPSVTISLETPPTLFDRFKLSETFINFVNNVVVSGPVEQIEAIKKGEFKPKARLEISSLDATGKKIARRLQFDLPPGVSLTQTSPGRADWEFQLLER